jgi:S-adenosylmethionine hydrolase
MTTDRKRRSGSKGVQSSKRERARPGGLVTLLTDFGTRDGYVGAMKGMMLSIEPSVRCIDITHDITPHRVDEAAFVVSTSGPSFPSGTVHVVVVDPGVGSSRRPLAAYAQDQYFIAPDNGVLTDILVGYRPEVRTIDNPAYIADSVSSTFHGRDIFAPVAAHLVHGISFDELGPIIDNWHRLERPRVRKARGGRLVGKVVHVDRFGNIVTNLRPKDVTLLAEGKAVLRIGGITIHRLSTSYSDVMVGEILGLFGSSGRLEISVNKGRANDILQEGVGSKVWLEPSNVGM